MCDIAILTATYNHPAKLKVLYESLCKQNNKMFVWIIVDDGSKEETSNQVKSFLIENKLKIIYLKKENGGKASAVNYGLDYAKNEGFPFVVFIDDDEVILQNGIDIVTNYYEKYKLTKCGVIHFNRLNENGKVISDPVFKEDHIMTCQERKRRKYNQDGYTGYYMSKLGDIRFPRFEGEKYVGPSVLFMMLCNEGYEMVWAYEAIGQTEYLSDGITRQGRKLRIKNPRGMYYYCLLLQHKDSGILLRLVYSAYGYAYLFYSGLREKDVDIDLKKKNRLIGAMKPIGLFISINWKRKYS